MCHLHIWSGYLRTTVDRLGTYMVGWDRNKSEMTQKKETLAHPWALWATNLEMGHGLALGEVGSFI